MSLKTKPQKESTINLLICKNQINQILNSTYLILAASLTIKQSYKFWHNSTMYYLIIIYNCYNFRKTCSEKFCV